MKVPLFDLAQQNDSLREEIAVQLSQVVQSGQFCLGPEVERLETAFANYCGTEDCVAVNSGTSALHLALLSAGVGPGDEVITTPASFIATSWAIRYAGATPVFVDIDTRSWTLDATHVESAITPRTKAILPVHLYGRPADMIPLLELAERYDLKVVEDAAQAHGARYYGRRVGGWGDVGCFSFYPSKNLGAIGEGGALVTSDPEIAARARALRNHGQFHARNRHDEVGYNYRMDACQAAVLQVKLPRLDRWNDRRRDHARQYCDGLMGIDGLGLPDWDPHQESVFHLFVVTTDRRDELAEELAKAGIETGRHYPIPIHRQRAFSDLGYGENRFPVAERLARECLSLPMFPELTREQIQYVVAQLRRIHGCDVARDAVPAERKQVRSGA